MTVKFEGYIPVLGGQSGTVEVGLKLAAVGKEPDSLGNPQVRSEIEDLKMVFNGATLPLGVKNIQAFFPPTTISLTPEGKILKTDAPEVKLPVQLPGLNPKRFPDISYLPIEFPAGGVDVGRAFTFKRAFGESEVEYTILPVKISADAIEMDVSMIQDYGGWEDDRHNPTSSAEGASFRLSTHVEGKGTATFSRLNMLVTSLHVDADAKTQVTSLKDQSASPRDLKTALDVKSSG
jgi:hypothetical protein